MTVLTILEYPDPRLRKKAVPVVDINDDIRRIVEDMLETMYAEHGGGLAANQVNIQQRIVVMDGSDEKNEPICAINPEIISRSGTQYETEGCLSLPGVLDKVSRAAIVRFRALDRDGKPYEMEVEGYLAKCIQHEIDHLDGILFVDHLSRLKQERLRKKLQKARQQA